MYKILYKISTYNHQFSLPQFSKFTSSFLQSFRDELHSRLSKVIVAQVQLSQVGRIGLHSRGQEITTFLCDATERQPVTE